MSADTRQEASNAIKDFISTISPFVSIAMVLIGLIYTNQMKDNQAASNKMVEKMEKMEGMMNDLKNGQSQIGSRLDRHGERIDENRKRIETNENRINDLEKTVILENAGRK